MSLDQENEEGKGKSHKEVSGLKFHIKDLGSEIVDLHLDGNNLYILTKQNIQSFLMVDWNSLTRYVRIILCTLFLQMFHLFALFLH